MKRLAILSFGLALMLFATVPALAFTRSVTLSVPGMYCPSCPVTVRMGLDRVPGVRFVNADLKHLTVQVEVTDPHVTNRQLTDATANVGYSSTVVKAQSK